MPSGWEERPGLGSRSVCGRPPVAGQCSMPFERMGPAHLDAGTRKRCETSTAPVKRSWELATVGVSRNCRASSWMRCLACWLLADNCMFALNC